MSGERQLYLFKGARQKGSEAPTPSERQIHITVVRMLKHGGLARGWRCFHPANGEFRTISTGKLLKDMGVEPGASDLIFYGPPHASIHALEFKKKGGRLTDAQKEFLEHIRFIGGKAEVVDSVDAAIDVLGRWGAARLTLS